MTSNSTAIRTSLKGSTWAHARGLAPLEAMSHLSHLNVEVQWSARTLKDFGEMPISALAGQFDLLVIDHPSVGEAAAKGLLVPLDNWLPAEVIEDLSGNSVGPSWESYCVGGRPYALPIDAAGHVAAVRADLLDEVPPATWFDVERLACSRAPGGPWVALPLGATDVWCVFLSLLASAKAPMFQTRDGIAERADVVDVIDFIIDLKGSLHPESTNWNPIDCLERMSLTDEVVYTPALFGYSNYSRKGSGSNAIDFLPMPTWNGGTARPLIGGAGIAVSTACLHPDTAAAVASYLCSPQIQCGLYFEAGGQPGHRAAWQDAHCNAESRDFFRRTLPSLDAGYLRPRTPGFTAFQEKAGRILHRIALIDGNARLAADLLDAEWRRVNGGQS